MDEELLAAAESRQRQHDRLDRKAKNKPTRLLQRQKRKAKKKELQAAVQSIKVHSSPVSAAPRIHPGEKKQQQLTERAEYHRRNPTKAEAVFCKKLHSMHLPVTIQRQIIFGYYIVDFYLPEWHLVIEIDGRSHVGREKQDAKRQSWLETEYGLRFLRFTNEHVTDCPGDVINQIKTIARDLSDVTL